MDPVIIAVYTRMVREHEASVDDILVTRKLRDEFVSQSQRSLGNDVDEDTLLRRLHNLRKQSRLPRSSDILAA